MVRILVFWNVLPCRTVYRFRRFEGTYSLLSRASKGPNNVASHPQLHRCKDLKLLSERYRPVQVSGQNDGRQKFHNRNCTVHFYVINVNTTGDGYTIRENILHNDHTELIHCAQFHESNSNTARYEVVKTAHIRNSERCMSAVRTLCYIN
jgi:hypothetical protein